MEPEVCGQHLADMIRELKAYCPEPETRALVTFQVDGETVEMEYTEMTHNPEHRSNWDDAIVLYEGTAYAIWVEEQAHEH